MISYPLTISPAELRATLLSHGWFDLEPLKVDIENLTLELAFKNQHGDGAFKVFGQNGETFCNILHGSETLVLPVVENCLSLDTRGGTNCGCRSPRRRRYNPYEPEASLRSF